MLADEELHPTEEKRRFTAAARIKSQLVVDEFVELRLKYE